MLSNSVFPRFPPANPRVTVMTTPPTAADSAFFDSQRGTMTSRVRELFEESVATKRRLLDGDGLNVLVAMAERMAAAVIGGGKIMLCGNGGSAADAQHVAAEFLIRLRSPVNREGIPAIALAMDSSTLTACANDYGYDTLFARMVETLGRPGDVLVGITTSGRSPNVIQALEVARKRGIAAFGLLGGNGGPAAPLCDLAFLAPSNDTARVQETHITAGHALAEMVEDLLLAAGHLNRL